MYSVTAALHFWGSILGAAREYAVLGGGGDGSIIWTKPLERPRQHHELARGQTKGCCMLQDVHHHASGNVSRMGPSVPTQSVHTLM